MASFARTWLGDGRTPKLPSQDIGAPFLHYYPLINYPQIPGGCPLTTRSPYTFSFALPHFLSFFNLSSSLTPLISQSKFSEIFLPIVWTARPVYPRYLLACGHRHVVSKIEVTGRSASLAVVTVYTWSDAAHDLLVLLWRISHNCIYLFKNFF